MRFRKNPSLSSLVLVVFILGLVLAACSPRSPAVQTPTAAPATPTSSDQVVGPPAVTPTPLPPASSTPLPSGPTLIPSATPAAELPTAVPTLAATPADPVVGIEMNTITRGGGLDLVAQSGAFWVRRNALFWSAVEPEEGDRNWGAVASMESELKAAAANGLHVILIVRDAPYWAQAKPGIPCGPIKPEKLNAFASFMHDLVARYSQPPYNVQYWELGNEPDIDSSLVPGDSIFGCWGDIQDPFYGGGTYSDMLRVVYPAVKSADPNAQVVIGGLLLDCNPDNPPKTASGEPKDCTPARFLEGILAYGGGSFFDVVSFHAYEIYQGALGQYANPNWLTAWNTSGPSMIAKARFLRSVLAAYGVTGKKLMNTETALICVLGDEVCNTEDFENTKAYYAAQSNAASVAEGLVANIWYSVTGWRYSGLTKKGLVPLPVYTSLQVSAEKLKDAVFTQELTPVTGVRGYEFVRNGTRLWIVWSSDGENHLLDLPSPPASVQDVFGQSLPSRGQVEVGLAPLYLEWAP